MEMNKTTPKKEREKKREREGRTFEEARQEFNKFLFSPEGKETLEVFKRLKDK